MQSKKIFGLSQNESDNLCGPIYAFGGQKLYFDNWLEAFRGNWRHMEQASAYKISCKQHFPNEQLRQRNTQNYTTIENQL